MGKLLSAYFMRLKRDKLFWLALALSLGSAIYQSALLKQNWVTFDYSGEPIDSWLFMASMFVGFAVAAIGSLFLGTEYSDGALRNKVIAGHSRASIYLSGFVVCAVTGLLLLLVHWLGKAICIPLMGFTVEKLNLVLLCALSSCVMVLAYSGLTALIVMNGKNKAVNLVALALVLVALFMLSVRVEQRLAQEELIYRYDYEEDENGDFQEILLGAEPNALYIDGTTRTAYEFVYNALPNGQASQMQTYEFWTDEKAPEKKVAMWCVCSVAEAAVTSALGIVLFRKKNLN